MIYCFACREGRTPPIYIFISAPRRAHVVFLVLIIWLRSVVSPPTLRTGSLPKGLAGKWRAGGADRSWPKVYNLKPFGSGSEPRRKGKDEGKESDRDREDAGQRHGKVAFSCVLHDAIKSHRAIYCKKPPKSLGSVPSHALRRTTEAQPGINRIVRLRSPLASVKNPLR